MLIRNTVFNTILSNIKNEQKDKLTSQKVSPCTLNLSSMDLRVVLVLMVQTPSASDTSITGVDTVAAFLSRRFTSNTYEQNSNKIDQEMKFNFIIQPTVSVQTMQKSTSI